MPRGAPKCVLGCSCRRHQQKSKATLDLLRRPKKKRAGPEGCWATRVVYYRQSRVSTDCDICGRAEDAQKKRHHVDQCHSTDKIRGLLCQGCNLHLGRWEKIGSFFSPETWPDTEWVYAHWASSGTKSFRASLTDTKCQCCGRLEFSSSKVRHHVDHNPVTGKIRGYLCVTCNVTLGWFERNSAAVAAYLGKGVMP